jgi:predicted ATP-dependent endonuclease of OLD family
MQLARGNIPGVANKTQIIYCTHSPLFVGIDRIEQIRLLRKIDNGKNKDENDNPKITKIFSTNLDEIAGSIWDAEGKTGPKYTGQTLLPRIQTIMTPWMNEGFFADVAILVEGEDDRAAILGVAKAKGLELEGRGFSVIPCAGKTNINRPYLIFHKLGIPAYIIWDGDYDGKGGTKGICEKCGKHLDSKQDPKENHRLLALMGKEEEDWPEYIEEYFACFKTNLETTLRTEIGVEAFDKYLLECQATFDITKRKHAIKNPNIISAIVKKAKENGNNVDTLDKIMDKALALKNSSKRDK